jgi:hypothetical protein
MCRLGAPLMQAALGPQFVDQQQRGDVADALLDGRQADQLAVQLGQQLGNAGFRQCGREGIGGRLRGRAVRSPRRCA